MCIIYNDSIMSDFICDLCDKLFTRKESLDFHIENKVCADKMFQCSGCSNKFTSKAGLQRHKREFCRKNRDIVDEKDNNKGGNKNNIDVTVQLKKIEQKIEKKLEKKMEKIIKENAKNEKRLKEEIEARKLLEEEIKKLTARGNNIVANNENGNNNIVNNNGTINNNNVTNQYMLVEYGKEDITKISREEMLEAYRNGIDAALKLTQIIHFNPKYPENHNIYISNIKSIYASVYKGDAWELMLKEDLIDKIFERKKDILENSFDDHKDSLVKSRLRAYNNWIDLDDDDETIKKIKKNINLLLYNKKNIPIETQAKTKKTVPDEKNKVIHN